MIDPIAEILLHVVDGVPNAEVLLTLLPEQLTKAGVGDGVDEIRSSDERHYRIAIKCKVSS